MLLKIDVIIKFYSSKTKNLADFTSNDDSTNDDGGSNDPLAQTFTLETIGGEFITKMDVFFQIDAIMPVLK